jgi:hypothetical protein
MAMSIRSEGRLRSHYSDLTEQAQEQAKTDTEPD